MLCIIFTKQKLLAGVKLKEPELLTIEGKPYLEYGNQSMAKVLELKIDTIYNAYKQKLKSLGFPEQAKVPTALAFPVEINQNGSAKSKSDILTLMRAPKNQHFKLIHNQDVPFSFMYGFAPSPEKAKEPSIVLEALDEYLNVCYYNVPNKDGKSAGAAPNGESKNGKAIAEDFVSFKTIGIASGKENLFKEIVNEFNRAGLSLNDKDKTEIRQQINPPLRGKFVSLRKNDGPVNIRAELQVSERRYDEAVAVNKVTLANRLNQENLGKMGVKNVLLLGEYLENKVLKDYFEKELKIGAMIKKTEPLTDETLFKTIVEGLSRKTHEVIKAQQEAERLRQEEEERKRKEEEERRKLEEERKAKIARDTLIQEIRAKCTDASKRSFYEELYLPQGEKLGIPKEVLSWTIQEAIDSAALQIPVAAPTAPAKPQAPVAPPPATNGKPEANKPAPVEPPKDKSGTPTKPVANQGPSKQANKPKLGSGIKSLEDIFEIEGVLPDNEFITKKVTHIINHETKVIKILPTPDLNKPNRVADFEKVYQKELAYYQELSEIYTAREGKYYYRNFIERNTLKDFVRKSGMDKKDSFDKFNSNDLKLILEVWREIKGLNVSHANLTEYNILIIAKRKWNLQLDTEVRMVGFTSQDCSPKEMEEQVHKIWSKLIGADVYLDFRKKFKI